MNRSIRTALAVTGALAVTAGVVAVTPSLAAGPYKPVYAANFADPAIAPVPSADGFDFVGVATGARVKVASADTAAGTWRGRAPALVEGRAPWASGSVMWAPDLHRAKDGTWVLYFAAPVSRLAQNQRCIGAATSSRPTGPFRYQSRPVVCPGSRDPRVDNVPGRPLAGAGVIDPSVFVDKAGRSFLLYKTQKLPATLRIVRLNDKATRVADGATSRELVRSRSTILENPALVQRGKSYVMFASYKTYNTCRYETVWMRSNSLGKGAFQNARKNVLMTSRSTGLCGPGGADIATTPTTSRIFFHGWTCKGTNPCPADLDVTKKYRKGDIRSQAKRSLYARNLSWNGATPVLGSWLTPR
ncbi:family 43 glycosylhydrolase [Knoellia koreensis]|uniref:Family 43 glycosylhydrolase n=1 Tax=Knoellia koreensis TaxID=2730921 RepID=A0A849HI56_9MICO|nr:family 43 glycosylhydrolase [Knoellia sp. DB2414S]NNM46264.1 family 43 glycosylhydrolase [Knoellia sp. DB2414S]